MEKFKGIFNLNFGAFKGGLVLSNFDTEHDLNLAIKGLERLCMFMAGESLYDINRFLEKYRQKAAKGEKG